MADELIDIKSMNEKELKDFFEDLGQPKFRAGQVFSWLHKGVKTFDEMTNIPSDLRKNLVQTCYISCAAIEKKLISAYDSTVKYLFSFRDGETVESVVMKYHHGYTICVSTQAGCKMGCDFCATGKGGFRRDLRASEILSQIQTAQQDNGIRISNIVLMGMGEPLDNYDNVIRFFRACKL